MTRLEEKEAQLDNQLAWKSSCNVINNDQQVHVLVAKTMLLVLLRKGVYNVVPYPREHEPHRIEFRERALQFMGFLSSIFLKEFPDYMLEVGSIQRGTKLGRGGMATVYKGKYGAIPVALKHAADNVDILVKEAATLMKLRHPNIVQVFGIWKDSQKRVFLVSIVCISTIVISAIRGDSVVANLDTPLGVRFWSTVCTETCRCLSANRSLRCLPSSANSGCRRSTHMSSRSHTHTHTLVPTAYSPVSLIFLLNCADLGADVHPLRPDC